MNQQESDIVMKYLLERRCVRTFDSTRLPPQELIDEIIKAGLYAPNGRGMQASIVIAVQNKALRDRLSEMNRVAGGYPEGTDPFYGAPVVLAVLADRKAHTYINDGSLMLGNMMLAAYARGLGACWIHRAKQEFESPEGQKILADLGVTGDYEGIGHCVLGYCTGELPKPAPRREGRVFYAK